MIKHTVYSDRVEATYSEGDSWYETIAEYFKKHTNFEEHVIDNIVDAVYIKRYNSGMKFMGTAKYNNPSDIKRAEKISTERLKEKYNRLMYAVLNKIVAYYEPRLVTVMKKGRYDMKNKYSLVGVDDNAYSVMDYVKECMREVGISQEEQLTYIEDATDSDYHHLLYISSEMVDKCNRYANGLQELYDFVDAL